MVDNSHVVDNNGNVLMMSKDSTGVGSTGCKGGGRDVK